MPLLELIIVIAVFGLLVWAVTTLIPMPEQFKRVIYVVCVVCLVLYILQTFGLIHGPNIKLWR